MVADAEVYDCGYILLRRALIEFLIQSRHLLVGVDAIVVDDVSLLYIFEMKASPRDIRILLFLGDFFFTGAVFFVSRLFVFSGFPAGDTGFCLQPTTCSGDIKSSSSQTTSSARAARLESVIGLDSSDDDGFTWASSCRSTSRLSIVTGKQIGRAHV